MDLLSLEHASLETARAAAGAAEGARQRQGGTRRCRDGSIEPAFTVVVALRIQ
jgi:hypothetical protein